MVYRCGGGACRWVSWQQQRLIRETQPQHQLLCEPPGVAEGDILISNKGPSLDLVIRSTPSRLLFLCSPLPPAG
ncbi:unnamed protein product, partial [Gadus morhua 'NCC']